MTSKIYSGYANSHALVIGINDYKTASPLGYAVNDANAVSAVLQDKFHFSSDNVHLLLDKDATRASILQLFLSFSSDGTDVNDRVVVFYAGHGYTVHSRRGEVGFLIPHDGDINDLSTLIRWDELTRDADLITAKHILFIMDACYGGLAITRSLPPGSMRFIKDMLLRHARQVLTAGKADEVVADLGGPLPDHSVFTGHLIEALDGKAADPAGIITANGIMAYVYRQVGHDPNSKQTPHFGYLDGDGDLIFSSSVLTDTQTEDKKDEDILVSVPAVFVNDTSEGKMDIIDQAKELLSEEHQRIKLHDLVAREIREVISLTSEDHFSLQAQWSNDKFAERLKAYEKVTLNLLGIEALLAYWGMESHREILTMSAKRISGPLRIESLSGPWHSLRWYSVLLLLYSGGISAVASGRYDNLATLMQSIVTDPDRSQGETFLILAVSSALSHLNEAFKTIPGYQRRYTPRSEYLFKQFQPILDDLLFLGTDYGSYFDRFEILLALQHAEYCTRAPQGRLWGPVGMFGWKYHRGNGSSPFHQIINEADSQGDSWPPIKAGLFQGSIERFKEIASQFSRLVDDLGWR